MEEQANCPGEFHAQHGRGVLHKASEDLSAPAVLVGMEQGPGRFRPRHKLEFGCLDRFGRLLGAVAVVEVVGGGCHRQEVQVSDSCAGIQCGFHPPKKVPQRFLPRSPGAARPPAVQVRFTAKVQRAGPARIMPGSSGLDLVVQSDISPAVTPDLEPDDVVPFQRGQGGRRHGPGEHGKRSRIRGRQEVNHLALVRRKRLDPPSGQVELASFRQVRRPDHHTTVPALHNPAVRQRFVHQPARSERIGARCGENVAHQAAVRPGRKPVLEESTELVRCQVLQFHNGQLPGHHRLHQLHLQLPVRAVACQHLDVRFREKLVENPEGRSVQVVHIIQDHQDPVRPRVLAAQRIAARPDDVQWRHLGIRRQRRRQHTADAELHPAAGPGNAVDNDGEPSGERFRCGGKQPGPARAGSAGNDDARTL
ncbi:hypothetical protein D9M72_339310 [compost metagenome]